MYYIKLRSILVYNRKQLDYRLCVRGNKHLYSVSIVFFTVL